MTSGAGERRAAASGQSVTSRAGGGAAPGDVLAAALARAPDLTVRSLRVRAVELPSARPLETAAGTLNSFPFTLIDLQTNEGPLGRAYVSTYTPEGNAAVVSARAVTSSRTGIAHQGCGAPIKSNTMRMKA